MNIGHSGVYHQYHEDKNKLYSDAGILFILSSLVTEENRTENLPSLAFTALLSLKQKLSRNMLWLIHQLWQHLSPLSAPLSWAD